MLFLLIVCTQNKPFVYPDSVDHYCGKIVQVKDDYALIKNNNSQIAVFSKHSFSYFDEVCVEGTFNKHIPSSNFFTNPIENWIATNNHLGSLNSVNVISHKQSNSIKGRLFTKTKLYPENEVLMGMLFDYSLMQNTFFSVLLLSSGLQYTYTLQLFRKISSKLLYKHQIAILTLILWVLFGFLWGYSFIWWRVFLCNVCVYFFKDRNFVLPISYTVLLVMFSNMANHVAFVFPMFFQLFLYSNRLSKIQKFSIILMIQHVYLYSSNLLLILLFSLFRHVSGILYIFSWLALLFIDFYPMYQIIVKFIFSLPAIQSTILFGRLLPGVAWLIMMLLLSKTLSFTKTKIIGYSLLIGSLICFMFPFYDLVLFVNVGQADATIIRKSFNRGSLLIDTAKESNHVILSQTFKGLGLKNLDAILISHDDSDHSGGLQKMNQLIPNATIVQEKKDIHVKHVYFQSLNNDYVGLNNNDNSVIGIIEIGQLRYLFLGDMQKEGERYLVNEYPNLLVDIVKLGHHGSKTSTSDELISTIQPRIAIVSAKKSVYGHPHDSVLKTLHNYQVIPLDTNTYGDIAFISMFDWQFVLTSSGLFGIIR